MENGKKLKDSLECPTKVHLYKLLDSSKNRDRSRNYLFMAARDCWREYVSGNKDAFVTYFKTAYKGLKFRVDWGYSDTVKNDAAKWERAMHYLFYENGEINRRVSVEAENLAIDTVLGSIRVPFILQCRSEGGIPSYHAYYFNRCNKDYISSSSRVRRMERKTENNPILGAIKLALSKKYPDLVVHCLGLRSCEDDSSSMVPELNPVKDDCFHSFGEWKGRDSEFVAHIMKFATESQTRNCMNCKYANYCSYIKDLAGDTVTEEQTSEKMLTEEQQAAVDAEGVILLSACPGSGKTTVMVERINRLIRQNVTPEHILAMTFSNQASENIRRRVSDNRVVVQTIHSFCYDVLNMAIDGVTVASDNVRYGLITELLNQFRLTGVNVANLYDTRTGSVVRLDDILTKYRTENDPNKISYGAFSPQEVAEFFERYETLRHERNIYTFDELLHKANELLEEKPTLLKLVKKEHPYILIDEFQDIDPVQFSILQKIKGDDFFVVGDADQNIYEFRDASNEYMTNFKKYFPDARIMYLTKNFRSTEEICQTASRLISHNKQRLSGKIESAIGAGKPPRSLTGFSAKENIERLVEELHQSGYAYGDIAVICRTNSECRDVVVSLGVNKSRLNHTTLIHDPVFRTIYAVLRLYNDDDDTEALLTLALLHTDSNVDDISSLEDQKFDALWDKVFDFIEKISTEKPVAELLVDILKEFYGKTSYPVVSEMLLIMEQSQVKTIRSLTHMLSQMEEMNDKARVNYPKDPNRVTVLTAHDSKGLEYPCVIISDLCEFTGNDESERRLLYVACTRAEQELIVCQSGSSTYYKELFEEQQA